MNFYDIYSEHNLSLLFLLSKVNPEYVEVDLGKAEQLTAHFLKVNPKHQVVLVETEVGL